MKTLYEKCPGCLKQVNFEHKGEIVEVDCGIERCLDIYGCPECRWAYSRGEILLNNKK